MLLLSFFVVAAGPVPAQEPVVEAGTELADGLELFLEARLLEAAGDYRKALSTYAEAMKVAPDVLEVRVRYAALLYQAGLAETAASVLDVEGELDWYGRKIRALSLAQLAGRRSDPALLEEAEEALRSALEVRDDDPNLYLSLAQVLRALDKTSEAEEVVRELRAVRGDNPQLIALHAGLLRQLGQPEEAVELYRRCVSHPALGPACRQSLVELLTEMGRLAEAGEVMLTGAETDDLDRMLRAAVLLSDGGRLDHALRAVRRVLAAAPDSERARTLEALLLSAMGRHREAAASLRDLLRKDRSNVDLIPPLSWSTAQLGDLEEARELVQRAWEIVSDDAASSSAMRVALAAARLELLAGSPSAARDWLLRVGDPAAAGVEMVRLLAETYRREERWEDGIAEILRLAPRLEGRARREAEALEAEFLLRQNDPRGWRRLRPLLDSDDPGVVQMGIQVLQILERWEDVARVTGEASERLPGVRALRFFRAAALERLGRIDESVALFQELLEERPDDAAAANYLGYMWADRNENLDEALELIERAVAQQPESSAYLDSLGWVHYRLGNLEEAERWLRRAIELGGGADGTVLAHLGEVLVAAGRPDEALPYLRQALEVGTERPDEVRQLIARLEDER